MYMNTHIYKHTHIHVYKHPFIYAYVHLQRYVEAHTRTYIYIYIYIYMLRWVNFLTYSKTNKSVAFHFIGYIHQTSMTIT